MDKSTIAPTVPISFVWSQVTPDPRAYKPSAPVLAPIDVIIVVDVPLDKAYIYNAERIIQAQISPNAKPEKTILTPRGLQYCVEQLETAMTGRPITSYDKSDWDNTADDDDWTNK